MQDPGVPLEGVDRAAVASRWPALAVAAWFPVIADGLASNLRDNIDRGRTPGQPPNRERQPALELVVVVAVEVVVLARRPEKASGLDAEIVQGYSSGIMSTAIGNIPLAQAKAIVAYIKSVK